MGGHGALTIALRNPDRYRSVSAFAPISAPRQCPWGQKAFTGYLGPDRGQWSDYDATELVARVENAGAAPPILIDQGLADQFLRAQLHPHLFEEAREEGRLPAQAAPPGRLRPRLLLHLDVHGGPSAPPREDTGLIALRRSSVSARRVRGSRVSRAPLR